MWSHELSRGSMSRPKEIKNKSLQWTMEVVAIGTPSEECSCTAEETSPISAARATLNQTKKNEPLLNI